MTTEPQMPLTAREVAALLGVATRTVHRWADTGRLPAGFRTPGGHLRFHAGHIWALLEDDGGAHSINHPIRTVPPDGLESYGSAQDP